MLCWFAAVCRRQWRLFEVIDGQVQNALVDLTEVRLAAKAKGYAAFWWPL